MENLWHILDIQVRTKNQAHVDLKQTLTEEWSTIDVESYKKLIESLRRRLQTVIDEKGMHTKY